MKILKLFKSKFIFKTPTAKEVLILDYGTCYFNDLFLKNKANILKTRGEEYYLNILIISFFEWMGLKDKSLGQLYIINCIKYFKPKFILTFHDYNLFFLSLKKIFPEKKINFFSIISAKFYKFKRHFK